MAITCYADEGYGTCSINSSEYVEATAYVNLSNGGLSGTLVLTNHSGTPLQSANIKVTVNYRWTTKEYEAYEGDVEVEHTGSTTIYNSRWTGNIPIFQSERIDLSGRTSIPSNGYSRNITSIEVSVDNPVCH